MTYFSSSSSSPNNFMKQLSPFPQEVCRCENVAKAMIIAGSSLFTGAAIYINLCEHPAHLQLDNAGALKQWKESFGRAIYMQVGLAAVTSAIAGTFVYRTGDKTWLIGAGLMLANFPFTLAFILPLNKKLKDTEIANSTTRDDLVRWNKLHAVRSVLGLSAVAAFVYAFAK